MSTPDPGLDAAIRDLLVLMPRMVGRAKRIPVPAELQSMALAPRHLSLLSNLLFDGAMTINEMAGRLALAPTTVSLMAGELSAKGVLVRRDDPGDRRRKIIDISPERRPAVSAWLSRGAVAWRRALEPLTPEQRRMFVATLHAYEQGYDDSGGPLAADGEVGHRADGVEAADDAP
jgi:DNA-binding MarR family transcriptional regulator